MSNWLKLAVERSVFIRAVKVGLIVGTLLILINHWEVVLFGKITIQPAVQIFLTYLVPYSVSTYASVEAVRGVDGKATLAKKTNQP